MSILYDSISPSAPTNEQTGPFMESIGGAPAPAGLDRKALGKTLESLMSAESVLYAITREWRYDAASRGAKRLHALLDEQFTEIGVRLTQLAARSRALGGWNSTGHGDIASLPRAALAGGALEAYIIRELLTLHQDLIVRLQRTRSVTGGRSPDHETAELMAALALGHEADARALRSLLSEFEASAG